MEPNQGIKVWQWVVTAIVIVIIIVLGYYMSKSGDSTAVTDTTPTDTATLDDADEISRIVVSDQYPGNIVYVSSVQLANPGWVVVQKDNAGKLGAVIGSGYFNKGINPGKITLSEKTVDAGIYYAVLYSDNGDKVFNMAQDLPLKDSKGNVIMKIFRATTNITEVKG